MGQLTSRSKKTMLVSACIALGLLMCNYFLVERITSDTLRIALLSISSTIATVLIANVLWEVIAKENFAKSLLEMVRLSESVTQSGIDAIFMDFREIDWSKELSKSKSFTAVFTYAYSWRANNDQAIRKFASNNRRRAKMNIIVPDPEISDVTDELDKRFNFESGECYRKITDCINYFTNQVHANVYLYKGTLQSSYYMMDGSAIMSFFTHSKDKGTVPAVKATKNGQLYHFIESDIHSLMEQSDCVEGIEVRITNGQRNVLIRRFQNER